MNRNHEMKMSNHKSERIFLLLLTCLILICGCATPRPKVPSQNDSEELVQIKPKALLGQAKKRHRLGPPPFTEQMAPLTKDIAYSPKRYSLVFKNTPLEDVITVLTKDSEYNLSIESEVDLAKPVTVNLKNVTLKEALDVIVVNGTGYAWTIEKGTLAIKRFVERIYQLDYLDMVGATEIDVGGDMLGSGVENSGVVGKYQIKAGQGSACHLLHLQHRWARLRSAVGAGGGEKCDRGASQRRRGQSPVPGDPPSGGDA